MQTHEVSFSAARLSKPPSEHVQRFYQVPGLERERRQFAAFSQIDLAHTVMLVEQGILSKETGRKLLPALIELRDLGPDGLSIDPGRGSLLFQIEAFLAEKLGEDIAGAVHTARSRIDQSATARRLYKRSGLLNVIERIGELQEVLISVAEQHVETIMPSYTHMQQAQPGSFGHYLLGFVSRFEDDFRRAVEVFHRVNISPLGTVGLSGTSWPVDRERTAELLGFDGLVYNSKLGREAYYAAEIAGSLSFIMSDLNDFATDLHIWSSNEFRLVELDDSYCSTSSIFPHKKNPVTLETIKGAAGPAVAWSAAALATFRGEGTGDQAIRSVSLLDTAFITTANMLELGTGILRTLHVNKERMAALVLGSWSTTSNLADVLVRNHGFSFRQAHHVVGRLVRICSNEGISPQEVSEETLAQASSETVGRDIRMSSIELRAALDPFEFALTRTSAGGVAPSEIAFMAGRAKSTLSQNMDWLRAKKAHLSTANHQLDIAIADILA